MKKEKVIVNGEKFCVVRDSDSVEIRKSFGKLLFKSFALVSGGNIERMSAEEIVREYALGF